MMIKNLFKVILPVAALSLTACNNNKQQELDFIQENLEFAEAQTKLMLDKVGEPNGKNYPRTMNDKGSLVVTSMYDWTPGFFPGSLWYLYELSNDKFWLDKAEEWTHSLEKLKHFTGHHDLGFMMYCSYGNAMRLAPKAEYDSILITSAASLASRYSPITETIKSWNYRKAWNDTVEWFYPVIIDNMMNLELLTQGSKLAKNDVYKNVAITHANTTLKNQFRPDYTNYHVVNYDPETGEVLNQATCQGYSDNSVWARGQAWAIYGYAMMYRETGIKEYLDGSEKMTEYYLNNLPEDLVPLWDFNVGQEGYNPEEKSYAVKFKGETLRDASAAAITCSGLFELGELTKNKKYTDLAIKMLHSLGSDKYRAPLGENANFILLHSVGSIPHINEIDKPLVYADYYFLEALVRYRNLLTTGSIYA